MVDFNSEKFADRGNERMVLSCILRNPELMIDVSAKIKETDFLSSNHRALFSTLKMLHEQNVRSFDLMGVINAAEEKGVDKILGGVEYVDALLSNPVDPENLFVYVDRILDCSTKNKLYQEVNNIQEAIVSNTGVPGESLSASQLISEAETRILEVSTQNNQVEDAIDLGSDLKSFLKERSENPVDVLGLPTGIPLLDKSINGLTPGSLSIVAARQKGGKSTLLLNMACHVAYNLGVPVLYIDTEMSRQEVQTRTVSHLSGVPERMVTNGKFIENNLWTENVWRACAVVEQGAFYHKYMPGFNMDAVKSMIRKFHAREGIGVFFFDYIKLPEVTGSDSFKEHQILGNVATGLKDLAGQLNIPGVAAAQIKRGDTTQPKTRFHDNDVADSDRIGRYCNNLLAIGQKSRKEVEEDGVTCGTHRLQVLLSRSGTPNFHGIDISCNLPTLTMEQAEFQSNTLPQLEKDRESDF